MRHSPHDALPHPFVEPTQRVGVNAGAGVSSRREMLLGSIAGLFAMGISTQPSAAEEPVSAEMPIDHQAFDEQKELKGEPLARFTKSPEYRAYLTMMRESIGLLNIADFQRAAEHRRIQGCLQELTRIINPLPAEIHALFHPKTRGAAPKLRGDPGGDFPLEWQRRMDGLQRFLDELSKKTPVRLPPGKISISLAISEYKKQTGYSLSFANERIVFGLPREIVIRPGANNHLNVLMSILDIKYTLSFGNDPRSLKVHDALPGDPILIGSGDIVGLMEEGKAVELRSTPSKGMAIIPDMHQIFRGGHTHALHGFRHSRKPEHLKTKEEKEKDRQERECAHAVNDENPPRFITESVEFMTGAMRRTVGNATGECPFDREPAVGRQDIFPEKKKTDKGWEVIIRAETALFKDREHLDYGWRLATSEQNTYRVRLAGGRVVNLKPDYVETSGSTATLHASTTEEPLSIIADAPEEVSPEFDFRIPARSLEPSTKPL